MHNKTTLIIDSEQNMLDFGRQLARKLNDYHAKVPSQSGIVIELVGDVGTGKTTITRGLAEGLGIVEPVTSPSFTISKQYAFVYRPTHLSEDTQSDLEPNRGLLVHYDFYRLPEPGLMVEDLAESISNSNAITVIEWGESVASILPDKRCIFYITLNDDNTRTISAKSTLANELLSMINKEQL